MVVVHGFAHSQVKKKPTGFSGVRVAQTLVFSVVVC